MNILVLNGSPRPDGNTTAMIRAFNEGASEVGHEVTVINVCRKKIGGCLGCEYCHTKGKGACIQKDDMYQVYDAIKKADMIVLGSPVYYFSYSGQLQSTINRLYALGIPQNLKKSMLLLSSGSDDVYEAIFYQYHRTFQKFMKLEDMGIITAYGDQNKSQAILSKVRDAANKL
ncbi:flavodoxin family protein [Eubacteriaceae bacterium ES3]|nr:flavodoxin family protein [Eubacteriaceae bacterium ES3]